MADRLAVLERLKESGLPQTIKVDGSEFISKTLDAWAHRHGREARVQPARQAYRQCFHRKLQWQIATGVLESELVQAFFAEASGSSYRIISVFLSDKITSPTRYRVFCNPQLIYLNQ